MKIILRSINLLLPAVTGWLTLGSICHLKDEDARTAAGICAQIGGSLLGFIIAALAILVSISSAPLIEKMRQSGHYKNLIVELFRSGVFFGLMFVLAMPCIFSGIEISQYLLPFSIASATAASLQTSIAGRHFFKTISAL